MRPVWLSALFLSLVSCVNEKGPTNPATGKSDGDGSPDCVEDDQCGELEICEEQVCVEGDRDNTFEEATPIFQNQPLSGVIYPAGDVDTYVYTSLGPEWLRIETTTNGDPVENLDTVVQVFAANGAEHAVMDNFPTGRVSTFDTVLYVFLPSAGTWYVTVEDVSTHYTSLFDESEWRGGEDFGYTLHVTTFGSTTAESDAMDTPSSRVHITSGSSIWAVGVNLETPGDSDWIELELPTGGQPLDVYGAIRIPGSPARPRVRLYDPSGGLLLEKDDLGEQGIASFFDPEPGTYLLEATDVLGAGGQDAWYVLYIRTYEPGANHPSFGSIPYEPEREPNDHAVSATPHELFEVPIGSGQVYYGQYVQGRFDDDGDEDWFVVDTSAGEKITARCFAREFGSLTTLEAALFSGAEDITPPGQGDTPTALAQYLANAEVPQAGRYHVRLRSGNGAFGPGAYYRCRFLQATFDFTTE